MKARKSESLSREVSSGDRTSECEITAWGRVAVFLIKQAKNFDDDFSFS